MVIDARNLECPKPIILTKQMADSMLEGAFDILLNSDISKENVSRFLKQQGIKFTVQNMDRGEYKISAIKGYACNYENSKTSNSQKVVFIKSDHIGDDVELGRKLLEGFLMAMLSAKIKPSSIIFVNSGVFVTTKDLFAKAQDSLKSLHDIGVEIYSCGACLDYYNLEGELKVGSIGNALSTIETLLSDDVVSL